MKKIIQGIFSIKNDPRGTHKIITALGIKFKFKAKKLEQRLLRKIQQEKECLIKDALCKLQAFSSTNICVYFDHSLGGGTETYFFNQLSELSKDTVLFRIQYFLHNQLYKITMYENENICELDKLDFCFLAKFINKLYLNKIILSNIVAYPNVKCILDLISNYKKNVLSCEVIVKGHDFYSICPEWNLLNYKNEYCNIETSDFECLKCFDKFQLKCKDIKKNFSITSWRKMWNDFFINTVDVLEVFSPSSKEIFSQAYPNLKGKIVLNPHKIKPFPKYYIGILGQLLINKGAKVVDKLLKYLELNSIYEYHFVLIGHNTTNIKSDLLTVLGSYNRNNLPNILKNNGINLILIPSIWHETFSYTTAEAIALDYPVACFDLGGQADQVKQYSKGKI